MVRHGNMAASSIDALLLLRHLNKDDNYIMGYRDGKASRLPDSRQAFRPDEYIEGYTHGSIERDIDWQAIRAYRLRVR